MMNKNNESSKFVLLLLFISFKFGKQKNIYEVN